MDKFAGALIFAAGLVVGHNLGVFQGASLMKADQLEKEVQANNVKNRRSQLTNSPASE